MLYRDTRRLVNAIGVALVVVAAIFAALRAF
jgi:hypothetical protein